MLNKIYEYDARRFNLNIYYRDLYGAIRRVYYLGLERVSGSTDIYPEK